MRRKKKKRQDGTGQRTAPSTLPRAPATLTADTENRSSAVWSFDAAEETFTHRVVAVERVGKDLSHSAGWFKAFHFIVCVFQRRSFAHSFGSSKQSPVNS